MKKEKRKKITIIIILLFIVSLVGYYVYEEYISDTFTSSRAEKSSNKDKDEVKEEKDILLSYKGIKKIDNEKSAEKLTIYKDKTDTMCQNYSDNWCDVQAFDIEVVTSQAKILATYLNKYILYFDEIIKLYDAENDIKYALSLENSYDNYEISADSDGIIEGIVYSTKDGYYYKDYGYYDLVEDEKKYEDKYDRVVVVAGDYLEGSIDEDYDYEDYTYDEIQQFYKKYLINKKTGEEVLTTTGECATYNSYNYDGGFYITESHDCIGESETTLYTSSLEKVLDKASYNTFDILEDGTIYVYEDQVINVYNDKGKKEDSYELDSITNFYQVINEFALVLKNDKLMLINTKTDKKIELCDWNDEYSVHTMLSGYYKENQLQNENEKKAGIYIVVGTGYDSDSYEEKGMEFYIDPKTSEITKYELDMIGGYAKPVLYLYPKKEIDVKVNFEHEEDLTTTYPKFNDEWNVLAKPNGDLYDKEGKYYYGLYWEEKGNHQVTFDTGFYVTKANAIDFLEDKLSIIGLSDRERNEFIMYWLPILEQNGQSVVYFELTEERDSYNKLEISPKPDSILRVAIHVKKVDKQPQIKEQELTTFERKGFVAVEWGGALYK